MPATTATAQDHTERYVPLDVATRRVMNPIAGFLTRRGLALQGSRVLTVVGRRSGEPRSVTVNPIEVDGIRYLVAPRGGTEWVRNLRAAGRADLRVGRRHEAIVVDELADDTKPTVLRAYVAAYGWMIGSMFDGVDASSPLDAYRAIAGNHPVFRVR